MAPGEVPHVVHGPLGGGQVAQRVPGVVGVRLAGVGQAHGAAGAVQELHPHRPLQLFDLLREGRL